MRKFRTIREGKEWFLENTSIKAQTCPQENISSISGEISGVISGKIENKSKTEFISNSGKIDAKDKDGHEKGVNATCCQSYY